MYVICNTYNVHWHTARGTPFAARSTRQVARNQQHAVYDTQHVTMRHASHATMLQMRL